MNQMLVVEFQSSDSFAAPITLPAPAWAKDAVPFVPGSRAAQPDSPFSMKAKRAEWDMDRQRIRDALANAPQGLTQREVEGFTKVKHSTLRNMLAGMTDRGEVICTKRNRVNVFTLKVKK